MRLQHVTPSPMIAPALPQRLPGRAGRPNRHRQHSQASLRVVAACGRMQGASKGAQEPPNAALAAAAAVTVLLSGTGEQTVALCVLYPEMEIRALLCCMYGRALCRALWYSSKVKGCTSKQPVPAPALRRRPCRQLSRVPCRRWALHPGPGSCCCLSAKPLRPGELP